MQNLKEKFVWIRTRLRANAFVGFVAEPLQSRGWQIEQPPYNSVLVHQEVLRVRAARVNSLVFHTVNRINKCHCAHCTLGVHLRVRLNHPTTLTPPTRNESR